MQRTHGNGALWVALACLVASAGCGAARPSSFYLLTTMEERGEASPMEARPELSVGVGPVRFPEHLDRPQIVTREAGNRVRMSESQRWAESLDESFEDVFLDDLGTLLGSGRVVRLPLRDAGGVDYRVELDVLHFDAVLAREARLVVRWSIVDGRTPAGLLAVRKSAFVEPTAGAGYENAVAAMNRALAGLAREVAGELSRLAQAETGAPPALE